MSLVLISSVLLAAGSKTGTQLWAVPGNPVALRVAVINNAAPELDLKQSPSHLFNGTFTSPPPQTIPLYGGRSYNYGYALAPDSGGCINSTLLYTATNCTSCPYV
jgi:hypothetical protein